MEWSYRQMVHYMCPNAPLAVVYYNDTGVPVTSVDIPDRVVGTAEPAECFYSVNVQAAPDAAPRDLQGMITVDRVTQPIRFVIS